MGKQERRESPVHLLRCMDLNSILTSDKGALPYQSAHTRIHTASLLCLACSSDPSPCADPLKGIDFGANFDDEEKEPAAESQADLIHIRVQQPTVASASPPARASTTS